MPWLRRALLLPLLMSAACVRTSDAEDTAAPLPDPCTSCQLTDANNFAYESSLDLVVHPLAELADVTIDWSALTRTVRGGPLDPYGGVDDVWLVVFQDVEPAALMDAIANDQLQQQNVTLFTTCTPVDATCTFGQFAFLGNDLDVEQYFTEGRGSWLVVLNSVAEGIVQSMTILQADAEATETVVQMQDGDATLSADVDMASLTPVVLPPDTADITVDWSQLTTDGLGNALTVYTLDRMLVGRFPHAVPELEAGFFDLEAMADETWEVDIGGRASADLSELAGATPFPGISAEDTWLLALFCSTCENPSPRFLTRLQAESP